MTPRTIGAAGLIGILVAVTTVWVRRPLPASVEEAETLPVRAGAPDTPCPDRSAKTTARAHLAEGLKAARDELADLRRRNVDADGEPIPWPEEVDPALTEDAVLPAIESAMAGEEGELLALDCSEYPCMGVAVFPGGQAIGAQTRFFETLKEDGYLVWGQGGRETDSGVEWYTFGLPGLDLTWDVAELEDPGRLAEVEAILKRRSFRFRDLEDAVDSERQRRFDEALASPE